MNMDQEMYSYYENRLFKLLDQRHALGRRPPWWRFAKRRLWDIDAFCLEASIDYVKRAVDRIANA